MFLYLLSFTIADSEAQRSRSGNAPLGVTFLPHVLVCRHDSMLVGLCWFAGIVHCVADMTDMLTDKHKRIGAQSTLGQDIFARKYMHE